MDIHLELNLPIQFPFSVVHPNRDHDQRGKREWERAQWAPTDTGCQLRLLAWSLSMRVNAIGKYFFVFSSRLDGSHIIQSVCLPSFRRPKLLVAFETRSFLLISVKICSLSFLSFLWLAIKKMDVFLLHAVLFSSNGKQLSVTSACSHLVDCLGQSTSALSENPPSSIDWIPSSIVILSKTSEINIWNTRWQQVKTKML